MNKDATRNFSSVTTQQQVILRLPEDLADRVRKLIADGQQSDKSGALVIDIQQQESQPSDKYIFIFQTEKYYALLANLPTNVETHKTFDKKIFIKTGDIGQILIVFKTERERDIALSRNCKTVNGDYYPSGLTPPTVDIVRRKFELTRKAEQYPTHSVRAILDELKRPWAPITEAQSLKALAPPDEENPEEDHGRDREVCEVVYEEVVAFEEWMVSREYPEGVSAVITGREWTAASCQLLQDHPELLVTEVDLEEDRDREDYLSVIKVQKAKEEAVNTTEVVLPATLPPVVDQPSSVLMTEKSSLNGDGMEGGVVNDMAAGDDVNQLKLKVNLREKKQIEEEKEKEKEEEQQMNGEDNDEEEGEGGEEEGGDDEEEEEEETVIAMDVDEAHSGATVSDVTRATYVPTDVTAESGQGNMSVTEPSQIHAEISMNICPRQISIRDQAVLPSTVHSGGVSCDANERSGEGALVGVSLSAGVGVGAVDDIEAMKRAFEDASDSDDDEEDDDEGEGEATGGGGEEMNNDKNGEDEEDDDDDDDDGEEMILEEGVGSQTVGGHETVLQVELQTAHVEQEQVGEDEQGEDASHEEEGDEEGDEEDWMKDV